VKIKATITLNGATVPVELEIPDELFVTKVSAPFLPEPDLRVRWGDCSARTLHRLRVTRRLPYSRLGGRILYSLADVEAFEAASRTDARATRCKVARRA